MDSLHPPPAAPLLPGLRPIQVPLHTQKGLLAVRSFALPWNIQPNFQNEMIYFRSAHPTVPPSCPSPPPPPPPPLHPPTPPLRLPLSQPPPAPTLRHHP